MHFIFLGSAGAVPARDRDTTSIVFVGDDDAVLELDAHRKEARAHFTGEVEVARELVPYPL